MARKPKSTYRTFDINKSISMSKSCYQKVRYETEEEAEFQAEIRWINFYQCPLCKGFHLTSREKQDD